jgi:hypothetical protein
MTEPEPEKKCSCKITLGQIDHWCEIHWKDKMQALAFEKSDLLAKVLEIIDDSKLRSVSIEQEDNTIKVFVDYDWLKKRIENL